MSTLDTPQPGLETTRIFPQKRSTVTRGGWWLAGGVVLIGLGLLNFLLAMFVRTSQLMLQLRTTLPILGGLAACLRGRTLLRAPREVRIGPDGLTIVSARDARHFPWSSLSWAHLDTELLTPQRCLVLYDPAGRRVARLSDAFDDFDQLAAAVKAEIGRKGTGQAARIQSRKARRTALICAASGTFLLAITALNAWSALADQRAARLLRESAVPGEATIVRRFVAPNGVTHRLEYQVITPSGGRSATRNVEVERNYWRGLEGQTRVPVLFTKPLPTAVPRPPHPRIPSRTAEFAAVPRTSCGLMIMNPAAAAAAVSRNFRRETPTLMLVSIASSPC